VLAFGGSAMLGSLPALAQQAPAQRVEITGSNIKRIDAETIAPVEVITREQIERTGQPTVADVLRRVPANSGGSFGESFSNSFAPGAAGISLRGLGQKTTLVLINGRRTAGYGFAQNLQDTFVDLNSIPSSAVERIEILKDGASAIYGSDAIAGVVNIILRKDYRGVEASLEGGAFEGKNDYRFTLSGGFGDLGTDKHNVFGVLDYYKRDYLSLADTRFGATRDMRGVPGGRNFASLTGGGTWRQTNAAGTAVTNNFRAITECPGRVMTGPEAVDAGLINLTPPPAQAAATFATNTAQAVATNTFCTQDFNNQFTGLPGTERIGALVRGTLELSGTASAYAELGLSRVDTFQTFQAPFFAGTTGLTATGGGLRPYTYNINFEPGVAGNPFPTRARYVGVLADMGTRDTEIRSDTLRGLVGATYSLGSWDMDSGLGYSLNDTTSFFTNRLSLAGTSAVFNVPTTPQPPVPVSASSSYNLDMWSTNTAAVRDQMRANFERQSKSELTFIDTKASNASIFKLPAGDVGIALGAEFRQEKLTDEPAAIASSGGILGQGITATNGKRHNMALFSELAVPVVKSLEAQLALRFDKYSDYGNSTTPKVGLKWKPNDMFLLRANWGKGFRAPTLPEISPSVATFFTTVIDPEDGVSRQISGVFAGNPALKAETSTSQTLGFVFEPTKTFSVGVDLYKVDWRNVVSSPLFQDIIDESCPAGGPACPSTATVIRDPSNNQVVTILSNYENLAQRKTRGVDVDARLHVPTEVGKFTLRGNFTYVDSFKEDGVEYVGSNGGSNTIPRVRAAATLDFDRGPWGFTGRVNYTHSYRQELLPPSFFAAQDPRFQTGVYPERAGSYTTVDLFARYEVSKHITVSGAVLNVMDKVPPYDPGFSSTSLYDFSLHDLRGRQFRLAVTYKM
jgi:iron complex outermembrane receptor protein